MADETVDINFILHAEQALTDADKFRQEIDATKASLRSATADVKDFGGALSRMYSEQSKQLGTQLQALTDKTRYSVSQSGQKYYDVRNAAGQFQKIDPDIVPPQVAKQINELIHQLGVLRQAFIEVKMEEQQKGSQAFINQVDQFKMTIRDVINASQQEGVTITSVSQAIKEQYMQRIATLQRLAAEARKMKDTTSEAEYQKQIVETRTSLTALSTAQSQLTKEMQVGYADVQRYATSLEQISKNAGNAVLSERQLAEQIKQQYLEMKKQIPGLTTQEFSQNFMNQVRQTPIPGVDIASTQRAVTSGLKDIEEGATQATKGINIFGMSIGNLGQVVSLVFGGSIAILAVNALRSLIDYFKQAIAAGVEFEKDILRLKVSIQILQENGLNTTLAETLRIVQELNKEFPIFTKKSIIEGVSYIQLLVQNLGLTNEQMQNLERISASIAVVMGKDFNDAAREVALFLSSGYGEALQKTGILASRASVAHELLKEGILGGYTQATDAQRAYAAYNVLLEQSAGITKKATDLQKDASYSGERLTTAWTNLKNTIGEGLAPTWLRLQNALAGAARAIDYFLHVGYLLDAYLRAGFNAAIMVAVKGVTILSMTLQHLGDSTFSIKDAIIQAGHEIDDAFANMVQGTLERNLPDIFGKMKDSAADNSKAIQDEITNISSASGQLYKDILGVFKQFVTDMKALNESYNKDMAEIDRKGTEERAKLMASYITDIANINLKADQDIANANAKYQRDVADVNRTYNTQRADAERKYRENEIKAERDFQEKMRRLREDFILNLEDAVRERDALQIIRLTRKYNIDRDRLQRDNANERSDRRQAFADETRDAEAQRDERLRQLREELNQRVAEIDANRANELAARKRQFDAEQVQLDVSIKQQKDARAAQYAEEFQAMQTAQDERIRQMTDNWAEQYQITQDGAHKLYGLMVGIFGPSGTLDKIFTNYFYSIQKKSADTVGALIYDVLTMQAYLNTLNSGMLGTTPGTYDPKATEPAGYTPGTGNSLADFLRRLGITLPGMAEGGTIVADKPTIAMFGERGRETATTFVPAGKQSSMSGKITVAIDLSPDLEARIIDNTMGEMAEIMLSVGSKSR